MKSRFLTRVSSPFGFVAKNPLDAPAGAVATVGAVRPLKVELVEDKDAAINGGRERLLPVSNACTDKKDLTLYHKRNVSVRLGSHWRCS